MKVGFLSTRLAGTDGVSLETRKWAEVAQRLGHGVYYCAGQLDDDAPNPTLIPQLHFRDPVAMAIGDMVFGRMEPPPGLEERLEAMTAQIAAQLRAWLAQTGCSRSRPRKRNDVSSPTVTVAGPNSRSLLGSTFPPRDFIIHCIP